MTKDEVVALRKQAANKWPNREAAEEASEKLADWVIGILDNGAVTGPEELEALRYYTFEARHPLALRAWKAVNK